MKGNLWMRTLLVLSLAPVMGAYAGEFYTIIGPDGRPMVIQRESKKVATAKINPPAVKTTAKPQHLPVPATAVTTQKAVSAPVPIVPEQKVTGGNPLKTEVTPIRPVEPSPPIETVQKSIQFAPSVDVVIPPEQPKILIAAPVVVQESTENSAFADLDGEQYVQNEYLEEKEFNLESKKRFYTMPEGVIDGKIGATRLQTVEREKGVGQSALSALFKPKALQDDGPITLAKTYYRVSQQDAINGLGQQCFAEKKLKKVKKLEFNKDVNFWPRAPLNDEFDFEVAALNGSVQNIQLNSYASKQHDPTFYWPFVVFLDAKGCVLEGAGGYKNQQAVGNFIQHEKIEGVLHVPKNSQFIVLTPLASAIDVEDRALTNHGQVKLVAIR